MPFRVRSGEKYLVDYFWFTTGMCTYIFDDDRKFAEVYKRRIDAEKVLYRIRHNSGTPYRGTMEVESFSPDIETVMEV